MGVKPSAAVFEDCHLSAETLARVVVGNWLVNEFSIHKRPPFRAHSFDDDGRFWVVGSTGVSVLESWHGTIDDAERMAQRLNKAAEEIASA